MAKIDFDSLEVVDDVVQFTEDDHKYVSAIDGREYMSTTKLLKHYDLSPSEYDQVPESILKAKAAYGSAVHKALEEFMKGDQSQLLVPEVAAFDKWLKQNNMTIHDCISEQQVFDTNYGIAGTVDLQAWNIVADFKTTASLHTISVMWQLSIYNYLLHPDEADYMTYDIKVFWFQSNGDLIVKSLPLIPYLTLISMLEAWKQGAPVWVDNTVPTALVDKIDELVKQRKLVTTVKNNLKRLENEEEVLKEAIKADMADQGRIYANSPTGVVTLTETVTRRYSTPKVDELLKTYGLDKKNYTNETTTIRMNVKEKMSKTP